MCAVPNMAVLLLRALYIHVTVRRYRFLLNNQPDALIIQIYSVIKLYMFRASSLPFIRSFLLMMDKEDAQNIYSFMTE
jgi:hypothetical protein